MTHTDCIVCNPPRVHLSVTEAYALVVLAGKAQTTVDDLITRFVRDGIQRMQGAAIAATAPDQEVQG